MNNFPKVATWMSTKCPKKVKSGADMSTTVDKKRVKNVRNSILRCRWHFVCVSVSVRVRVDLALFQIYSPPAPQWRCESITGVWWCSAVGQTPREASYHTYRSWLHQLWPRASGVNWFSKVVTQGPGDLNDITLSPHQAFTHTPLKTMSHFLIHLGNTHTSICDVLLKHICQHSRHPQNLSSRVRFFM